MINNERVLTPEEGQKLHERIQDAIPQGIVVVPNLRFDFEGYASFAQHFLGLNSQEAIEWVLKEFHSIVEHLNSLKPSDFIVSAMAPIPEGSSRR